MPLSTEKQIQLSRVHCTNPRILACGYREILIPKTGSSFPAFLVAFPNQDRHFWRSKRDFLLLSRATSENVTSANKIRSLPKAALKKLAEKTPWKRPDNLNHRICIDGDGGQSHVIQQDNYYHASMKKSILQIDQFLQQMCSAAMVVENKTIREAWDLFSRAEDTEGLVPIHNRDALSRWLSKDQEKLPDNSTDVRTSSQLGQYFCTEINATQAVRTALEKLGSKILDRNLIFLEPSCGHGDVVFALVRELCQRKIAPDRVRILAYDIDPNAVRSCEARWSSNTDLSQYGYTVSWRCENFLETVRPHYLKEHSNEDVIVCVGGPPYTTGAGSSVDMKRDLPTKFVQHCLSEWDSFVVSFLLPDRYRNSTIQIPSSFRCETRALQSSTFYFQGSKPVTQPSILQCFSTF